MAQPGEPQARGLIGSLLDRERRLLPRLEGVLRFDDRTYREIEADPHAIPQSLAVVIVTAALAALGQGGLVSMFLGLGAVIVLWMAVTGLIWAVGLATTGSTADFAKLLRCTGFAYVWFALLLFGSFPIIGTLCLWGALLLSLASLVIAARVVLETDTPKALLICAIALGVPLLVLFGLTRLGT